METNFSESKIIKNSLSKEEEQILNLHATDFIKFFGNGSPGQKDTPLRMVKVWKELLTAEPPSITVFESNGYDQMIIDKDIPYFTFCEHHVIPFFGTVKIGYLANTKIIGLSKLARIVDYYSKRLNTQEYFTMNIANWLNTNLQPLGVGVVVKGRHLCKEMRGVKSSGEMITSCLLGNFKNIEVREEFMKL